MKKYMRIPILILFILGSILAGCAQADVPVEEAQPAEVEAQPAEEEETEAEEVEEPLKIALVISTSIADSGWDSTAYQGLLEAEAKYGAEISVNENTQVSNTEAVVRDYASRGYDLIIVNSFSFGDGTMKVAPDFPDSKFVITTGIWEADNVSSFDPLQEDYFLSGCLDALMSKSGKIGIMGGVEMPAMIRTANAISDGAKYCNPDIEVSFAYIGSWGDPAKAKELALAMIASGIDVIDGSVSAGFDGILEATKQAEGEGKIVYTVTDMVVSPDFPVQIMAAHTQDHGQEVMAYTEQVVNGTFVGGIFRPGLESGIIYLVMTDTVPADIQAQIEQVQQDIIDGKVTIIERFTQ